MNPVSSDVDRRPMPGMAPQFSTCPRCGTSARTVAGHCTVCAVELGTHSLAPISVELAEVAPRQAVGARLTRPSHSPAWRNGDLARSGPIPPGPQAKRSKTENGESREPRQNPRIPPGIPARRQITRTPRLSPWVSLGWRSRTVPRRIRPDPVPDVSKKTYKEPPSGQCFQCVFGRSVGRYLLASPVARTAAMAWKVDSRLGRASLTRSG
jgi:hypothetical protein